MPSNGRSAVESQSNRSCNNRLMCAGELGLLCLLNINKGEPELDVDISYNPFECDCKDFNIISTSRLYGLSHALDRANCDQPVNLYQTKVCCCSVVLTPLRRLCFCLCLLLVLL